MALTASPSRSRAGSKASSQGTAHAAASPQARGGGYLNPNPRGPADTMALSDKRGLFQIFAWGQGLRQGEFGRKAIQWVPRPVSDFDATSEEPTGVVASAHRVLVWTQSGNTHLWRQGD